MSRTSVSQPTRLRSSTALCGGATLLALCLSIVVSSVRSDPAAAAESLPTWTTSQLDLASGYASIAVDDDGAAHVSAISGGDLIYATDATGTWVATVVATPGTGLTYASAIALDAEGAVHIAYDGNQSLDYATNASGAWVVTTVDDPGFDVGDDVSLALDSAGNAHVSCLDRTNGHVRYATNASGSWVVTDIGSYPGWGGYQTSIAVDGSDAVHIIHNRFVPSSQLVWTTNASGQWESSTLTGTAGYYNSLKVDSLGNIHVSFYDGSLYYGTNASGSWQTTLLDGEANARASSALVLDSAGRVHVTYGHHAAGEYRYATNSVGSDPGVWSFQVVDDDFQQAQATALVVDSDGDLFAVYRGATDNSMRYATTRPPAVPLDCTSVARQDGWILESRAGKGVGRRKNGRARTLRVGDDRRNRQYRSILSFRTEYIPDDAVIVSATLRLQRKTVRGADPFTSLGALLVDVGGPGFGRSPALRRADFQADAGIAAAGTLTATGEEGVYEAQLGAAALERIDRAGFTQFRLAFETATNGDRTTDRAVFFSGSARPATRRPVLEIEYREP